MTMTTLRVALIACLVMVSGGCSGRKVVNDRPAPQIARALPEAIVVDTHIDTTSWVARPGWRFDERHQPPSSGRPGEANAVDLPRMKEGGLNAAFFAVYVPATITGPRAVSGARAQLDALWGLATAHPTELELCRTAAEVRAAVSAGKRAILIGIEGGHMIGDDLGVLEEFARRGARYLTLTHTVNTTWADSSGDTPAHNGLTPFGRDVIRTLNRTGVMVDVSHVSDKTFWDVIEVTRAPVIASHSSCRALCGHPRNLTDEMIKAIAATGGTVQINFEITFLDQAAYEASRAQEPAIARRRAELERQYPSPEHEAKRSAAMRAFYQSLPQTPVSWEKIIDHIDHAVRLVGADHVGLGSDFDGATMPQGMEDCTGLPKIAEALLARGYRRSDVRKILGENILRVMAETEAVARRLAREGRVP